MSGLFAVAATGLFAVGIATSPAIAAPGSADATTIPLCHRTSAQANSYVYITGTAKLSIVSSRPRFENDIFPPFTYVDSSGNTVSVAGQNWDAAGQLLYANLCVAPTSGPTQTPTPTTAPPTSAPPTQTTPPTTAPPTTAPPTQNVPPTTAPPTTAPPTTAPPTTAPPTTAPVTVPKDIPTTSAPVPSQTAPSQTAPAVPVTAPSSSDPAPSSPATTTTAGDPPASSAGPVTAGDPPAAQGEVSLRAQTAAGAPAPDYTTSNAFFVAGVLMLLGTLAPKFGRRPRRRGMHR